MMKIEKHPLYKLRSKSRLSYILNTHPRILDYIVSNKAKHYTVFCNKNGREIQAPKKILKTIHKNIKRILENIHIPYYLFVPNNKNSKLNNIKNAQYHLENKNCVVADIRKFYFNTKLKHVFNFFYYKLKMSEDISKLITNIIVYDTHEDSFLSTGSPVSQIIAYLSFCDLFYEINSYARRNGMKFSLYVDDLTFSSKFKINKKAIANISIIFQKYGLQLNDEKTKYYNKYRTKRITGIMIDNHKLRIQNKTRKKIIDKLNKLDKPNKLLISEIQNNNEDIIDEIISLKSIFSHISQIEENIFTNSINRINKLYKMVNFHTRTKT